MAKGRLEKEELERLEKIAFSLDERFDVREYGFRQAYERCEEKTAELEEDWETFCAPNTDIVAKTKIGKKWALRELDFDYDATDLACYIYYKLYFPEKLYSIVPKGGEYRLEVESVKYRGDVMNSWSTTLRGRSDAQTQQAVVQEFMKIVYTIGNLIPCPDGCNRPVTGDHEDYWDLSLWYIYRWYYGGDREKEKALQGLFGEGDHQSAHRLTYGEWLGRFGTWDNFVKENFMQPFVQRFADGSFGEPLELWDNHFSASVLPQTEGDFEQFFVNARIRILERGKLMVAVLNRPK